jgi:predicted Zn-dependent protease
MRAVRPSAQTADILGLAAPPPTEPPKAPTPFQLPSWVPSVAGGAVAVALVVYVLASGAEALSTKTLDLAVARTATDAWLAAGEPGPVRTDDVAAAIEAIGQSVAVPMQSALGDRKARFVVVDDLQSVRTLSLPDGTVVVSTGLLLQLRNEAQVAAILAHALAHIANGDVDDTVFRLRADDEIASAASLREGVPAPRALISAMSDVAQSSFEIVEELDADRVMLEALGKAGWSNDGLNTFIADLISKGSRRRPAWLLQHPENGDRSEARVRARAEGRVNIPEFSTRIAGPLAVPPPSKATDTDKAGTEVAKDGARP